MLEKVNKLVNGLDRLQESIRHGATFMDPEMPGDGWRIQEHHYHNQQYHGELEDSIDIWRNRSWASGYQMRNFPRRLLIAIAVYIDHVAIDPSDEMRAGYRFAKDMKPVNHLLFMDDLKLYGASKDQLDSLVQVVRISSKDIRMSFRLDKCAVLEMRRERQMVAVE